MRSLIFVRSHRTDLNEFQDQVASIRSAFVEYLQDYPVKSSRSKVGLMGPVGKVLSQALTGKWDAKSLAGYALNIHLSNPKSRGYIAPSSLDALHRGVHELLALMNAAPPTVHERLLDRVDYGIYYERRKSGMVYMEKVRREFEAFLKSKYGTVADLNKAWGLAKKQELAGFDAAPYPSANSKRIKSAGPAAQADVNAFAQHQKDLLEGVEVEEEDGQE